MANNPKKVKDPTEVALSAIQEALNISDVNADTGRGSIDNELAPPTIPSSTSGYSDTPFETRPSADRQVYDPIDEPRGQLRTLRQLGRPKRRHSCSRAGELRLNSGRLGIHLFEIAQDGFH